MQFEVSLLKFLPNDDSKVFASHLPNPLLRTSMQIVHIRDGVDLKTEKNASSLAEKDSSVSCSNRLVNLQPTNSKVISVVGIKTVTY